MNRLKSSANRATLIKLHVFDSLKELAGKKKKRMTTLNKHSRNLCL